jgi:hypothetical protein
LPVRDDDWIDIPRTAVLVRRQRVVEDAIQEAQKSQFDPTKLLKVGVDICTVSTAML